MKPLACYRHDSKPLLGVAFDLDATVLTGGRLRSSALRAIESIRAAGLQAIACTGRSAGFGEAVARTWPVDLSIAENGAIAWSPDSKGRLQRLDNCMPAERAARSASLETIKRAVMAEFPSLRLADDNFGRLTDVAFDIAEFEAFPADRLRAAEKLARSLGARTACSSIHFHITLEAEDKASGLLRWIGQTANRDPTSIRFRYAFVGDSGNDAPCFAGFRWTFGVANIVRALRRLSVPPRFISHASEGEGFVEVIHAILLQREVA